MVGNELLVVPPLTKDNKITVYLPKGANWHLISGGKGDIVEGGTDYTIEDTFTNVSLFQRKGTVVVTQDVNGVKTTEDLLTKQTQLTVFPDADGRAFGQVYLANGALETEEEQLFSINYDSKTITFADDLTDV